MPKEMTGKIMNSSYIDYQNLVKTALQGVVREILLLIEKSGLQGEHHYYITFRTNDEGVKIPARLKAQYPIEMTFVIQHRYWDLKIEQDYFEIGLSFNQKPELLVIPFAAITSIVDPSERFALQFDEPAAEEGESDEIQIEEPSEDKPAKSDKNPDEAKDKVVSIDAFRKN